MSMRELWQLTMRKSALIRRVDVLIYISLGIMREQETKRTLRSYTRTSTVACFAANEEPNLTSLTRTMTPKLASEGSDENLRR